MAKHYLYVGINHTLKEIYFGVSKQPKARIDGYHCDNATVALRHWDCGRHNIEWGIVDTYADQPTASATGHALERQKPPAQYKGYTVIQTAGI
jgi:hypothetical protein